MMSQLSVGVVIPTYNSAAAVTAAIESALSQEPAPAQVVVVDDGSTDGTADALRKYAGRIAYVRQANRGPAAARNVGLARLATNTVVFLDADDLLLAGALAHRAALLAHSVVWAHTDGWIEDATGARRLFSAVYPPADGTREGRIFGTLLRRNFITTDSVIARREVVSGLGGFDETIRGTEDWELWLRLAVRYPLAYSHEPTFLYRARPRTLSGDRARMDRMRYLTLVMAHRLFPADVRHAGVPARRSVADAYNGLGYALACEGRWRDAAPYFAASLRLWPLQGRTWLRLLRGGGAARSGP